MVGETGGDSTRRALAWVFVALWILLILGLGGDGFSREHTDGPLRQLARWIFTGITDEQIDFYRFYIRKGAHFGEYAVLALVSLRALRLTSGPALERAAWVCLGLVLAVALLDEARQSMIPSRQGNPWDVARDLGGGTIGLALLVLLERGTGRTILGRPRGDRRGPSRV